MWPSVNAVLNAAVGGWLWLFQRLPPVVQLCALALPVTVLALLAYRWASNQAGIHAVKNQLKAHLLELRLFKDDLGVTWRAQGQILKNSVRYAGYALAPLAIMIVPVVLILIQIEARYAFRPLVPGESTIVEVTVDSATPVSELQATLAPASGLICETPALRLNDEGKILWRVRAQSTGDHELIVRLGEQELRKRIRVGEGDLSAAIYRAGDIRTLAYPLEPALADDSIASSIEVAYPRSRGVFADLSSASWIMFAAALVLGYVLRGLFGVTF